tara:strand:+ start:77 stop:604 length:528 start_codon:yes stop_codon:yes gene_type:complete
MAIPMLFIEWWFVILATLFVIIIESAIVNYYLKLELKKTITILFKANLLTTIVGYLAQGVARIILGIIFMIPMFISNFKIDYISGKPIIEGLFATVSPIKGGGHPEFTSAVITNILTSMLITFALSVIIERKFLISRLENKDQIKLASKSIIIANIISYSILTIWVFYSYSKMEF